MGELRNALSERATQIRLLLEGIEGIEGARSDTGTQADPRLGELRRELAALERELEALFLRLERQQLALAARGPAADRRTPMPSARYRFEDLIGADPALLRTLRDARRAAEARLPILITGESGTGKEMLAQAIHNASDRAASPFVGINLAAIPRELLESELFGYERGAFTGARGEGLRGKLELAGEGTVLLDEIGELPRELQAKLLRVLEERVVRPLGGHRERPIHARVIAATHRDLEAEVEAGRFRLDLFYRLRGVQLRLPPLRERAADVPLLAAHFLERLAARTGRPRLRVDGSVMEALVAYRWPGNVRELAHLLEAEASLLPPESDRIRELPAALRAGPSSGSRPPSRPPSSLLLGAEVLPLEEVEKRALRHALRAHAGNVAKAARALGLSRATLYNKMKRYDLRGSGPKASPKE